MTCTSSTVVEPMAHIHPKALMAPSPNRKRSLVAVYPEPVNLKRHAESWARIDSVRPQMTSGECVVNGLGRVKSPMPASAASRTLLVWKS